MSLIAIISQATIKNPRRRKKQGWIKTGFMTAAICIIVYKFRVVCLTHYDGMLDTKLKNNVT